MDNISFGTINATHEFNVHIESICSVNNEIIIIIYTLIINIVNYCPMLNCTANSMRGLMSLPSSGYKAHLNLFKCVKCQLVIFLTLPRFLVCPILFDLYSLRPRSGSSAIQLSLHMTITAAALLEVCVGNAIHTGMAQVMR